jgi:CNT family concentrative nucleoside transporter
VLSQISPGRSGDVSRVAISALFTGVISTLTSASIAGLLVTNQESAFAPPPPEEEVVEDEAGAAKFKFKFF